MAAKNLYGQGMEGRVLNTTVSDTTVQTSHVTFLNTLDNISYQLISTGTVAGAWTVEVSNNYTPGLGDNQAPNSGNWVDITSLFTTVNAVTSGGSDQYIEKSSGLIGARAIRVKFTPTSGAGTVSAWFFGKGM